jgi:hypothetical protein
MRTFKISEYLPIAVGPKLTDAIDRHEWAEIGHAKYYRDYILALKPVIIRGAFDHCGRHKRRKKSAAVIDLAQTWQLSYTVDPFNGDVSWRSPAPTPPVPTLTARWAASRYSANRRSPPPSLVLDFKGVPRVVVVYEGSQPDAVVARIVSLNANNESLSPEIYPEPSGSASAASVAAWADGTFVVGKAMNWELSARLRIPSTTLASKSWNWLPFGWLGHI